MIIKFMNQQNYLGNNKFWKMSRNPQGKAKCNVSKQH
jgi:hypothetical protein